MCVSYLVSHVAPFKEGVRFLKDTLSGATGKTYSNLSIPAYTSVD